MRRFWTHRYQDGTLSIRFTDFANDASLMVFLEYDEVSESEARQMASVETPIYPYWILAPEDDIAASEVDDAGHETIWTVDGCVLHSVDRILFEEVTQ